ncbi:universal stress protein [Sulfuracidifex metallicus]|jgi:nucleotide-binding universal stress UspA family protein|uniref:Universal stress protein n=1 Tax=Sulfuracidifex metallicus DSM 6482 = JCM 9184 TaxID=523847 RepID=A0A6A9QRY2_SULME|nr:universal stress protein [Sulfuracidifex metallicus]MUN30075.1 universal stress protein [Sulfuracidifex metallicus DSM 6482 = JCM 9184]WOE51539.1 universal stress protein [Sulfuracidifex metallicus DSM 6482 = JCM 9184]
MSEKLPPTYTVSFLLRKILIPVDGSENSMRAVDVGVDFAMRYGSRLYLVYVCQECKSTQAIRENLEKRISGRTDYEFKEIKTNYKESSVANEILKIITEESFDAVIMGARGTSINSDVNIGSTATSVALNAPITVIVVR